MNKLSLLSVLFIIVFTAPASAEFSIKNRTYKRLEKIRNQKKKMVLEYFRGTEKKAKNAAADKDLIRIFNTIKMICRNPKNHGAENLSKHEAELNMLYVKKYLNFYDILFVDEQGYVFHSIKKESDFHKNFFKQGLISRNDLSRGKEFIDFKHYPPSDEAASFFFIKIKGGCLIFQMPLNTINRILANKKNTGKTTEVYLVNEEHLMLTDSRFSEDSTALKQIVETETVKKAAKMNSGRFITKDYRGVRVFSSFEKFSIMGYKWIIIAEIDEAEVITEYFNNMNNRQREILYNEVKNCSRPPVNIFPPKSKNALKVDMNEFAKSSGGKDIYTKGVGTCTSVVFEYPDKFVYLSHISPLDSVYKKNILTRFFLGDNNYSYFENLINNIMYFELVPAKTHKIKVFVIASHTASINEISDKLIQKGFMSNQIFFAYEPHASKADVYYINSVNAVCVKWYNDNHKLFKKVNAESYCSLSRLIKNVYDY
ncbi:MAG: cache domain-containing protein [Candidatus Goldiibacteriota bacterium]